MAVEQDQSVETSQKSNIIEINGEVYFHDENAIAQDYVAQPRRKFAEKTIKGIVVGRGENRQIIDIEQVRKLAALNCSYADMAKFFGVKENTFRDNFRREVERSRETLKHRLMEAMITNAVDKLNPTVQIWLSKNLLGFQDNPVNTSESVPLPWNEDE
jgi:AraC-like DNA-binding protein